MLSIFLLSLAPVIVGTLLGLVVWAATRRGRDPLRGRLRWLAVAAGLLPVLVSVFYAVAGIIPALLAALTPDVFFMLWETRFVAPLVAGLASLALLTVPGPASSPIPFAAVARRTAFTYVGKGWLVTAVALIAVTVALSVAAGMASTVDEEGRYTMFSFNIGTFTVSTTIYGWHYSLPALALVLALVGCGWAALAFVARSPLSEPWEHEASTRRTRSRNIAVAITAALSLHLGLILGSLAGTSTLQGGMPTDSAGDITVQAPFAALTPLLSASSFVFAAVGVALWLSVTLTAVPVPGRVRRTTSALAS